MTAMNAAGRHGGSARVSRRLKGCALKAASETSSANRVLKATPDPPDAPEPPDEGRGGGALGKAPPDTEPAWTAASTAVGAALPSPGTEWKKEERSPPAGQPLAGAPAPKPPWRPRALSSSTPSGPGMRVTCEPSGAGVPAPASPPAGAGGGAGGAEPPAPPASAGEA
jgi:hypothetical protein